MLTLIYNPQDMLGIERRKLVKDLEYVRDALGTCAILLGSMDERSPNSCVHDFFGTAAEVWSMSQEELVPWVPCT